MKKILLIFSLFSIFSLSFFTGKTFAANAFPEGRSPCSDEKNPEYSADRPYQASPCGDPPQALFCGNDVVLSLGSVSVPYCDSNNGQKTECPASIHKDQSIAVDLTNVQLPILGNTQLTANYKNGDQIDDGTKTSNFVAWYLGGTNYKGNYPPVDPTTPEGVADIVDTSGPVQKLLPKEVQEAQRIEIIATASAEITYEDDDGNMVTTAEDHNQIVVCAHEVGLGIIGDILGIGTTVPVPCYNNDDYRLKDWNGDLSNFNVFFNRIGADIWNKRTPPLPWSNQDGVPFETKTAYEKAYYEWSGGSCITIPFIDKNICVGNPFVPNKWAALYPYIPLASTVDSRGAHRVENTHLDAPKAQMENQKYEIIHSPALYLAHSQENFTLTTELKSTYLPSNVDTENSKGYPGSVVPKDVEDNSYSCRILDSRINPGDDATFSLPISWIQVDVHYDITEIQCSNIKQKCDEDNPKPPRTPSTNCRWVADCSSEVYATVNTTSKTPYADDIWKNTVAGSDSIFRRIYPKTGPDSPITCIADTPAVSSATYSMDKTQPTAYSKEGISLWRVILPDNTSAMGSGGAKGSGSIDTQLYYPHYGGVLDYFLKGIQTALRPQGFAEPQPANGQFCTNIQCGELPELPRSVGTCSLTSMSTRAVIPQSLKDIISSAAQTYKVPPNLIVGIMYGEGLFNAGRFNWTEQNVKNWATCTRVPECNETGVDDNFMGFAGTFDNILEKSTVKEDIQKFDPARTKFSRCNLLDAIYAVAWDLHNNADGGSGLPPTCFGIKLQSTVPTTCTWNPEQYESAIKVFETGYTDVCFTNPGSCALGQEYAPCETGGDTCEKVGGSNNTSHNACVWDVAHGN